MSDIVNEQDLLKVLKMNEEQARAIDSLLVANERLRDMVINYQNKSHLENSRAVHKIVSNVLKNSEEHNLRMQKTREIIS